MTTPALAQESRYGRLYRHPHTNPATLGSDEDALAAGLLMPSVTNVIDTLNKPFLNTWYAKLAAQTALEVDRKHPGYMSKKPWAAIEYLKEAAPRHTQKAAELGDLVHNIVEALSLGQTPEIPENAAPFIESYKAFVEDFQPEFLHLEATCFGFVTHPVAGPLRYAGTADFIAKINDLVVIGDWKSGKSIHTEAGLQLAALANAVEMVTADGTVAPMPTIDAGAVVHLTRTGYAVHRTDPTATGLAWEGFQMLRGIWDFHQANLASRAPILMTGPVKKREDFHLDNAPKKGTLRSGMNRSA